MKLNKNLQQLNIVKQRGATLVVVLVILVAMTFLGLGSMSDSNLQLSMVRNSQMQTSAHTTALTEINAQMAAINGNAQGAIDPIIFNLVNSNPNANGVRTLAGVVNPSSNAQFEILLDDVLSANDMAAYQTNVILTQPREIGEAVSGFTMDDPLVSQLGMEFISTVNVNNTGAGSSQVQGFLYYAPAGS